MSVSFQTDHSISESSSPNQAIRVLLVYPNTREVALANLGFQQVYTLLNSIQGVSATAMRYPPIGYQKQKCSARRIYGLWI